jgi:iron complex transport system permease protein
MESNRLAAGIFFAVASAALVVSILTAVGVGSTPLDWATILRCAGLRLLPAGWVDAAGVSAADMVVVWTIRIPRALVAALVGAGLATAGVVMQGLFRNPLAEPGLTGASAGAILGAVASFVAGWSAKSTVTLPLCAMAGALAALFLVYAMATRGGVTPVATLLLAGIAVSALLSAVSSLLLSINLVNWQIAQEIVFWMMGGLDARTWTHVWLCAPFLLVGGVAAMWHARELDLLQQGEEIAASLGVDVEGAKRILIWTAALLAGACVAVAGAIGFVGLVVPHAIRLLLGPRNRVLLPAAALGGAVFLILCDLAARTLRPPVEIRLGIVTALVGGPVFIWLLVSRSRASGAI